ncbi:hypothetical protein ABH937_002281 [Kitasatospora sp. GAS1066B]
MTRRTSVLFALPIAALLAATAAVTPASAAPGEIAHGDFLFNTKSGHSLDLRNPPAGKCIKLPDEGSTDGTNLTDKTAHIFATFVSATDCRQQLAVAGKGTPGHGTPWSTPGFNPTAHAVRFDCDSPSVC